MLPTIRIPATEALETPLREALRRVGLWREPPTLPPPLPWLAVWITPFLALADAEDTRALGDLERCMAWALMESEG